MAKKGQEHTGFRNGDLFCFHCGSSQKMPLPMDVRLAADLMLSFAKHHKNCTKTWIEPSWRETENMATVQEKMRWWMTLGERDSSSECIFKFLTGQHQERYSTPSDPDDFRRCYLLIKAIPEWRSRLSEMKGLNQTWSNIIDNWDKLSQMLEEQMETKKPNGMYELMKEIGC